jgi:hypothetical protein
MVSLWLAILAAAVGVFIASSLVHMVLPYHRSDMRRLPADKEDAVLDALRRVEVAPGDYGAPHPGSAAGMRDPTFIAKATTGPRVVMTVSAGEAPTMGPYLARWFVYVLVVSACLGLMTWHIAGPGANFGFIFHMAAPIGLLAYGGALPQMSIWYRRSWATTWKSLLDSAIYGAVTGAAFGWLWPQ